MVDYHESYIGLGASHSLCDCDVWIAGGTTIVEIAGGGYRYRGFATRGGSDAYDPIVGVVIAAIRANVNRIAGLGCVGNLDFGPIQTAIGKATISGLDRYALQYVRALSFNSGRQAQTRGKHPLCRSAIAYAVAGDLIRNEQVTLTIRPVAGAAIYQEGMRAPPDIVPGFGRYGDPCRA